MRFTRKPFMTALMILALLIVGMGRRNDAQAMVWQIDDLPRQNSQGGPTPTSGEPDVGELRTTRVINTSRTPIQTPAMDRAIKARSTTATRWIGWIWVNRFLGMGL